MKMTQRQTAFPHFTASPENQRHAMRINRYLPALVGLLSFIVSFTVAEAQPADMVLDDRAVNLAGERTPGTMHYEFSTDYLTYAPDGSLISTEQAVVVLKIDVDETGRQTLTTQEFVLIDEDGAKTSLPRLAGWQNVLDLHSDELLGVPQAAFAGLQTETGELLAPEITHRVYNTYVDFYTFHNIFARPFPAEGDDVGDLTSIGQVIEHYSAYSRPAVSLGETVSEGSYFQNGRVTLEWKGMSRVDGNASALVGFDSGESSFQMALQPAPGMEMTVNGGSQYWGDLHINAETLWLAKGTFIEVVLARVQMGDDPPMDSVIKRIGQIASLN